MKLTDKFRKEAIDQGYDKPNQLFLSYVTKKPVSKQTISRWLKEVLKIANINTGIYSAHSFRGASLSHALNKGAKMEDIIRHGDWTNARTFKTYYNKPLEENPSTSTVQNLILNNN